ncbi:unnamed protein product, partial [Heterosigma akashiwo]
MLIRVHSKLMGRVEPVTDICCSNFILWLKCSLPDDSFLFLGVCYFPPEGAQIYNGGEVDPFDILLHDISVLQDKGTIVLVGDLNARIGQSQVGLIHDDDEVVDDFLLGRERILQDSKSNGFGKRLIRVCDGANALLLNGIFGGCSGNFTCVKWNGSSVVD